jgi:hypothetical protein
MLYHTLTDGQNLVQLYTLSVLEHGASELYMRDIGPAMCSGWNVSVIPYSEGKGRKIISLRPAWDT